ncbi:hypothetical protein [Desulfococcus multivorans]|uniref:Uncharacterized protein n=1 Tax=Desulfococcus multivorans DSM 2059 TaxID=1121405 RepID=S7T7E2_DESML|nr:hypothetical protein [Desulfococcus multivorans]EPR32506.1 hypothetical protein dsmv_0879 [Desulfococcus multivorans DSM 2059]SKA27705.1 hypothetical protein SAMN02745446_03720 [Desulfococcus multivorans DSM 2059]
MVSTMALNWLDAWMGGDGGDVVGMKGYLGKKIYRLLSGFAVDADIVYAPFFISLADPAGTDGKAAMFRKIEVSGVEDRLPADDAFQDGGF